MNTETLNQHNTEQLEAIQKLGVYQLARMADTLDPDTAESEGAQFLASVRDSVTYAIEYGDTIRVWEIADQAPDVYTHRRMKEFVDLGAYRVDVSDYSDANDVVAIAGVALYIIAERLVRALSDEFDLEDVND